MGKYKQWLHHQEIGRRLRDQINTLEQERARVQKMAPAHPTSLPNLDNPIVTALLSYTSSGNKLSNIDVIKAAMPALDSDPDQRRPAPSAPAAAPSRAQSAPASNAAPVRAAQAPAAAPTAENDAVVASLLARAEQMPSDPMEQMRELSRAREAHDPSKPPSGAAQATNDSVSGWWQRQRDDD